MHSSAIFRPNVRQSISHVNLHYASPSDGPTAALLLETLGLVKTQEMALPDGGTFYRFTANVDAVNRADNIIYLSPLPAATAALIDTARERLGFGSSHEDPVVAAYRAEQAINPESNFHVGFLVDSLEFLEERIAALEVLAAEDPRFSGRLKFLVNRALPGNAAIDERLDASPVYRGITRYTFGRNGVQAFCETDIIVDGPMAEGIVLEMDYVFPGYETHILSVSEVTPETARIPAHVEVESIS